MVEIPPTPTTDETPAAEVIEQAEAVRPAETARPAQPPMPIWIVLIVVAFALGISAGYMIWGQPLQEKLTAAEQKVAVLEKLTGANATAVAQQAAGSPTAVSAAANTAATAEPNAAGGQTEATAQQVKRYDVPIGDNPILGSSTAPITIIEFSDYQCPFCRRWHQEVWGKLQSTYGDKIRLVYRDFPLYSIHPDAVPAAEAADCAGEQNKYYDFHNLLLNGDGNLGNDVYLANAKKLGLDVDKFKQCVTERRYQSEVEADLTYASDLGVRSTPTFFINGLAVVGAQPFEVFQQIIDLELAGKIPK